MTKDDPSPPSAVNPTVSVWVESPPYPHNRRINLGDIRRMTLEAEALGIPDDAEVIDIRDQTRTVLQGLVVDGDFDASMARAHYRPDTRSS